MRKVLKPAVTGYPSATLGDTRAKTAAGTSPSTSRLIAVVCPSLSWTSGAPAATIAVLTVLLDAEYLSSIAIVLPARSDTDLMSGRTIRTATRRSVSSADADAVLSVLPSACERLELSLRLALVSGAGVVLAAVTRSASTLAAAACASIILVSALAVPAAGCGSPTLADDALASAAALRAGSGRVCGKAGGSGTRGAAASAFAAGLVGFAVLSARRARRRTWANDDPSVFRALVDLACIAAELILADPSLVGGPGLRSRQAKRFVSAQSPVLTSGDGGG
jgi:hypothetical protein